MERFEAEKSRKRMLLDEEKQGDKNMELLRARKMMCDVMYRYSVTTNRDIAPIELIFMWKKGAPNRLIQILSLES